MSTIGLELNRSLWEWLLKLGALNNDRALSRGQTMIIDPENTRVVEGGVVIGRILAVADGNDALLRRLKTVDCLLFKRFTYTVD